MKKQTCRVCQVEKEIEAFSASKRYQDGVTTECKACRCEARTLNQSYLKERLRKYKYRANQNQINLTIEQLEGLLVQPDCTYCGCELTSENKVIDHIYALKQYGGVNNLVNLAIVCRSCNSSKSNHHIYDFYSRSEKFTEELWTSFVRDFTERLLKRELTAEQVEKMKHNLSEEAKELARNV